MTSNKGLINLSLLIGTDFLQSNKKITDRQIDRERETDRDKQRQTETDREIDRETEKERQRQTEK
jgi:hypothetical protein